MGDMALGLIETKGLTAAVEAADAAVKAAQVRLLGYELTKGAGMVTIKLVGHVSAVQAAISAGVAAATAVGTVVSSLVIPRPHKELTLLVNSRETVLEGNQEQEPDPEQDAVPESECDPELGLDPEPETIPALEPEITPDSELGTIPRPESMVDSVRQSAVKEIADSQRQNGTCKEIAKEDTAEELCNLCGDPACPRLKGEPHSKCLHYKR